MRRLISFCFLLMFFWGCKKSDRTLSPIEMQVGGSTTGIRITLLAVDVTQGNIVVLNVVNRDDGSSIYSTAIVYPGDQINVTYNFTFTPNITIPVGADTSGKVTLNCFYKGEKLGGNSVLTGDTSRYYSSVIIPAQ